MDFRPEFEEVEIVVEADDKDVPDDSNCIKRKHNNRWFLKTDKDIKANQELTLTYDLYKP